MAKSQVQTNQTEGCRLRRFVLLASLGLLFEVGQVYAAPDFYLVMQGCKQLVGYFVLSNESLKVLEGVPGIYACVRRSTQVSCVVSYAPSHQPIKGTDIDAEVIIDSPPLLVFADPNRNDYFVIHTANHAATVTSRVLESLWAGSRVCQGMFTTSAEMEELRKEKPASK